MFLQTIYSGAEQLEQCCEALKKYRLTSSRLFMRYRQADGPLELTKEQCATLLKMVKPEAVDIDSERSNRFEALFDSKQVVEFFFKMIAL